MQGTFRRILLAADTFYDKMAKSGKERGELMSQLAAYRKQNPPYDLPFEFNTSPMIWWYCIDDSLPRSQNHIAQLAIKLFSITPHAASCERIWSSLGWFYGKRRTRLGLEKIERMQKLAAFYLSNAKKELPHYGVGKGSEELQSILRNANLYEDEEFEDLNDEANNIDVSEDYDNIDKDKIYLNFILDLDALEFLEGLDEFIEDSDIDLEEQVNDNKTNQEEIDEDWDPNLAVEAYL